MFIKNWKKEILTVPNLLSLFRLVLIPFYAYIYLNATEDYQYLIAGTIMAVSCITDLIDGKIARQFNQITTLGKFLDPLADKITQFTLTICLSLKYPILNPVLALFVVKESFQLIAVIVNFRRGKARPGALMAGKVCTTVLFITLIGLVLFPNLNPVIVDIAALVNGIFLTISFISYILAYFGKNKKIQDLET